MAVEPSKTMMLIAAWPDRLVAPELIIWATRHRFRRVQWYSKRFVECAYNSAIKRLALPSEFDHFIFADHDIRPNEKTDAFLQADGELVVCQYNMDNNESWEDPQAMHCGLWRCDRKVLEAIEPPWFQRVLTDDGTDEKSCVCMHFRNKALAAGFRVVRAGWTDHDL
jgi:hypothetical protein